MKKIAVQGWSKDRCQAMSELAGLFPTLVGATGVRPWKATQFVNWAAFHGHCSGSAHAVRFVLSVWNPSADWREILKEAKPSHQDPLPYLTLQQLPTQVKFGDPSRPRTHAHYVIKREEENHRGACQNVYYLPLAHRVASVREGA